MVVGGQKSNQFFMGLSSDNKPTTCDFTAEFYEWDTGKTYIWTGNNQVSLATPGSPAQGQWVEYMNMYSIPLDDNTDQT